jgi:hypothetical protein
VSRLSRYWMLWRSLPEPERRARAGRAADRLIQRGGWPRRLRRAAGAPSWRRLRRALAVDLGRLVDRLRRREASRGSLFGDLDSRAATLARRCPEHADRILEQTRALLDRSFDLLGAGPARPLRPDGGIDWHRDWVSGQSWDPETLLVLGQAYHLAPHLLDEAQARALRARCALEASEQIDDWTSRNPRGLGIHWSCAMEVALRAVSWTAALGFFRRAPEWSDAFVSRLVRSLWLHGLHVRRHLERGPDGLTTNHYLADLLGLLAVGRALPELRSSGEWVDLASRELSREMPRQVGPDGASFERSLPYHRFATEIFIHAALIAPRSRLGEPFHERLALMLEFAATCMRPDGTLPQWGDNDDGRVMPLEGYAAPRRLDPRHLLALGGRLIGRSDLVAAAEARDVESLWLLGPQQGEEKRRAEWSSRAFPDVGYYVLRGDDLHLSVPCGPVGTRGLGNHTHNDLLSLCVWAGGREWVTDPGTGAYSSDILLRQRLRSTAAHATLQLGSREQNELPRGPEGLFRVIERAAPRVIEWVAGPDHGRLAASHRGFSGPDGDWSHRREVRFERAKRLWAIDDELRRETAPRGEPCDEEVWLRFPLAPGVAATVVRSLRDAPAESIEALPDRPEGVRVVARLNDDQGRRCWICLALPSGSVVELESATLSPRYGVTRRAHRLVARIALRSLVRCTTVLFSPGGGASP